MKKIRCKHCRKPTPPSKLLNGEYCPACVQLCMARIQSAMGSGYVHMRRARKCIIPGCSNHSDEGYFEGDLCTPCHSYVALNKGTHSQAYRNEVFKAKLRSIAKLLSDNPGVSLSSHGDRIGIHYSPPEGRSR